MSGCCMGYSAAYCIAHGECNRSSSVPAETPATPADVGELVVRLRERWESTDAPVAKKINRYLKLCREAATALERVVRDRDEARKIISRCCNALPNGAYCSPEASIEFMAHVPDEILLVTSQLVNRIADAEAKLAEALARLETVEAETRERLTKTPIIEEITPTPEEWERCETIGDTYDLMKRRISSALRNLEPRHD